MELPSCLGGWAAVLYGQLTIRIPYFLEWQCDCFTTHFTGFIYNSISFQKHVIQRKYIKKNKKHRNHKWCIFEYIMGKTAIYSLICLKQKSGSEKKNHMHAYKHTNNGKKINYMHHHKCSL